MGVIVLWVISAAVVGVVAVLADYTWQRIRLHRLGKQQEKGGKSE